MTGAFQNTLSLPLRRNMRAQKSHKPRILNPPFSGENRDHTQLPENLRTPIASLNI